MSFFFRLFGALKSKNTAAYSAIICKVLQPFTVTIDKLIFKLSKKEKAYQVPPILIIVSPPRSGSTITYQVLTRGINSVCITNAHYLFPYFGTKLLNTLGKSTQKLSGFKNYYGYTAKLEDVNEGNEIIEMLLKSGNKENIRKNFLNWASSIGASKNKPLIIKNVRVYNQLDKLLVAIPEISVLQVQRDLSQNIQSTVRAYHQLKSFHPVPEELKDKAYKPVEFAFHQINIINKTLDNHRSNFPKINWMKMTYEELCENTQECVTRIGTESLGLSDVKHEKIPRLKASVSQKISDEELKVLNELVRNKPIKSES